ncbi:MAG: ABC transporter permease [Oscillospiraceae bacterium]|nr:ABC transporter permease [Oscillospiraceae bacterium]
MQKKLKKLAGRTELYVFLIIVALAILIQAKSGQFFTSNNLVDIASALIVPGIFAVGAFMVLISGGIDVSFPALASLTAYATTKLLLDAGYEGGVWLPVLAALAIGAVLGAFNGLFVGCFNLNAMIITLGASSVFKGFMQGTLQSKQLAVIPTGMKDFGTSALFTATNPVSGLSSRMPVAFLGLVIVVALAWFLLNKTYFGRGIYAIGGNPASAKAAGFNVKRTKFLLYVIVGMISSVAGLIRVCMMQQCHPTNMLGMEMNIIAGVVLGGTAITGGAGTLTGCMLGTLLIVLVENSMILIGVPTTWKQVFTGALIVIGTGVSAMQVIRANKAADKAKIRKEAA